MPLRREEFFRSLSAAELREGEGEFVVAGLRLSVGDAQGDGDDLGGFRRGGRSGGGLALGDGVADVGGVVEGEGGGAVDCESAEVLEELNVASGEGWEVGESGHDAHAAALRIQPPIHLGELEAVQLIRLSRQLQLKS